MVATKPMTAEDLAERGADERIELIEGELVEMSPSATKHGILIGRLNRALVPFAIEHDLRVLGEGGLLVGRDPDTVLVPDAAIATPDQEAAMEQSDRVFTDVMPLVAIEVRSPSERESRIAQKTGLYLRAGLREVWWVRPEERQIWVHRDDQPPRAVAADGALASDDLLPGFRLPLADLFR